MITKLFFIIIVSFFSWYNNIEHKKNEPSYIPNKTNFRDKLEWALICIGKLDTLQA